MKKYLLVIFLLGLAFGLPSLLLAQPEEDEEIEKLENMLKLSKNDSSRVNILIALSEKLTKNTPLKARQFAQEALSLSEEIKYPKGIKNSSENLGSLYQNQQAYTQAINYFNRALQIKEQENDQIGIAEIYQKLGNVYVFQDEFDRGIDFYKRTLKIREKLHDLKGIAASLTSLGSAYYRKNDFAESIRYHREAFILADSIPDRSLINSNLNRLGETYFRQEDFEESQRCYQQLLQSAQRINDLVEIQKAYLGLSKVAAAKKDYKRAYDYYKGYSDAKEAFNNAQKKIVQGIYVDLEQKLLIEKQELELAQAANFRQSLYTYFALAGLAFILIITYVLFRNYRIQQKDNAALELQKREIEIKNNELEEQKSKIELQNESINRKNETLEATFKEIERKNKDITASINYAKRIQESMLPRINKVTEVLPEHFILFRPRDIVSGDFYWIEEVNEKIFIVLLDCTGHGVPGAFMTMLGDSYLNQIIKLQGVTEPSKILDELHNSIGIALNQEVTKNQDGMDVALCVVDKKQKTLEFAGASRPLLIIQNGEVQSIESSKLPVGGFQKDRERVFVKHHFDLDTSTCFYIYSDGFQDQFGGPRGRKFAKNRLDEVLFENHHLTMIEQKRMLNKILIDWMGDNRQMDDILVMGMKV